MAVSCPTSPPNSTWWVGGGGGGEKPDGGFGVEGWPAKLTLLLFAHVVHAYGHGLQRKQGAKLGKRDGGGGLIWGAKHKSDIGGGAKAYHGGLGALGVGGDGP